MTRTRTQLIKRAKDLLQGIELSKAMHRELEDITLKLKRLGFKSDDKLELVDNFKGKNTQFKATAMKRFELKGK